MEQQGALNLLQRCAVGRQDADWAELVDRFGPRLKSRARWRLQRCGLGLDPDLAEEMLQEVYCRLLEERGRRLLACRGRTEAEVAGYLRRLADRVVIDHVRQMRAARKRRDQVAAELAATRPAATDPVDPGSSPEAALLARDGLRRLLARLTSVESGGRGRRNLQILLLSTLGGWTSREISRAMAGALGPSGVDSLLNRLKQRLRQSCCEAG